MNGARHGKWNLMQKTAMYWKWEKKSAMRSSWTYKLRENIISIAKEEKDLGVVIQDNLSPEKQINRMFGDTFMMLRNIRMAFHFLDKDMMGKIITIMIRPKLEYAELIWSPHKKKRIEIRKNTENCN